MNTPPESLIHLPLLFGRGTLKDGRVADVSLCVSSTTGEIVVLEWPEVGPPQEIGRSRPLPPNHETLISAFQ